MEMMVVVALIGILTSLAVPNIMDAQESAARNACASNLAQLNGAADMYNIDNDEWPSSGNWETELEDYMRTVPTQCPLDGDAYTYNSNNDPPDFTCGNAGH